MLLVLLEVKDLPVVLRDLVLNTYKKKPTEVTEE
jgi:hypothetical protein